MAAEEPQASTSPEAPMLTLRASYSQSALTKKNEKMVLRVYDDSSSNQYKTVVATTTTTVGEVKHKYLVKLDIPLKSADMYAIWAFVGSGNGVKLEDGETIYECFTRLNASSGSNAIVRCLRCDAGNGNESSNTSQSKPLASSISTLSSSTPEIEPKLDYEDYECVNNAGNMEIDVNFAGFTSPMPPATVTVNMWATAKDVVKTVVEKMNFPVDEADSYGLYTVILESSLETLVPDEELLLGIDCGDKFVFKKKK